MPDDYLWSIEMLPCQQHCNKMVNKHAKSYIRTVGIQIWIVAQMLSDIFGTLFRDCLDAGMAQCIYTFWISDSVAHDKITLVLFRLHKPVWRVNINACKVDVKAEWSKESSEV